MKRWLTLLIMMAAVAGGVVFAAAQTTARGFGFGGGMAMAFFPDMTGIDTFMSENGLPSMCDVLIGAGGNGRGGVIGGPSFGGIGWGLVAESKAEDRSAELVIGGGGFDIGAAVGGDENSVLTFGAVLGGGANILTLTGSTTEANGWCPAGIVPGPTERELVHVVGFVQPYVSLSAQLLPWMGFELRIGYIVPVFGLDVSDELGIPAPSLDLSGPTVSFGFVFGGIGSAGSAKEPQATSLERVSQTSSGTFPIAPDAELTIENPLGDITISSYAADATQTSSYQVEWQAVGTVSGAAKPDAFQVTTEPTNAGLKLCTSGASRVDYVVRIPSGIDLHVLNGAGEVTLVGHNAMTIIVENAAGNTTVHDIQATSLIVSGGVGEIDMYSLNAQTLISELRVGEISLGMPPSASATILAKAGLGDVTIDRFPVMTGGVHGFLGKSANVTLGSGEQSIELHTGLGSIDIGVQMP